jgi:S-formylglutathione hydrolase FrmB
MKREMPYRVITPISYEVNADNKFPVIFLLHGLAGNFSDWTERTEIIEFARKYDYIIVMPEGGDGWYSDSATAENDKYESYFIRELIPEIDRRFRTSLERNHRAVAGLSMGGYGAIKFGLKYPEKFSVAGSFSGALDAPLRGQNHQFLRTSVMSVFGAEDNQNRKDNDIFRIVREMPNEKLKLLPFIYLDCGTEDFLVQPNRDFAALLLEKKIPHEFRQLPGNHNWIFWDAQAREFFDVFEKYAVQTKAKGN